MRPWSGLVLLLLMMPGAQAGPTDPVLIQLYGQPGATHIALHWEVHGADLTRLELVRYQDGQVTVFPLDPGDRTYVDANVSAEAEVQYIIRAAFDGGVTASNLYVGQCPVVDSGGNAGSLDVQPECLRDLPVVPPHVQADIKEALVSILPS